MRSVCFVNGDIYGPEPIACNGFVLVEGGVITDVGSMDAMTFSLEGLEVLDARGYLVAPGFIDLQINGAYGYDLTQEPDALSAVAARLPRTGVTSFCPTLITTSAEQYGAAAGVSFEGCAGAEVLGWHLEGPYLNPARAGAHDAKLLRTAADSDLYPRKLLEKTRLVTLAPELPGMNVLIERLRRADIVVSAGHSDASYAEALTAFGRGVTYTTHLFNAMGPYHQREPGLVGAALDDARVVAGLIVDRVHLHPAVVRLAWRAKGSRGLTLVTDAMAAAGQPAGGYRLGDRDVEVDLAEKSVRLSDGTLAGSLATLDDGLRNLLDLTHCSLPEALMAASTTPARVVGLEGRKGRIAEGYDADLVWLGPDLRVAMTMRAGRVVYHDGGPDTAL